MNHQQEKPLPEHDQELIREARSQRWEDIDDEAAYTEEAREILRDMIASKYHREEYKQGII